MPLLHARLTGLLQITLLVTLLLAAGCACAQEGQRRALLIGINEYAAAGVNDLRGAENDVRMIGRVLNTRFGFPEANITYVVNEAATRDGMLETLDRFVEASGPNDTVYVHYSGHGSQVRDRNGDEPDGMDETILPHDARTPGVADITDDEIEQLLARLDTRNALVVFDSCHSGTVTRSVSQVQPRSVPPDTRDELYANSALTTRAVIEVGDLDYVLMTSAPPDEEALDGPLDQGFYGLFSYSLAHSLDRLGPDASPQIIHAGVKRELQRIREQLFTRPPEPQLEAPAAKLTKAVLPLGDGDVQSSEVTRRTWLDLQPVGVGRYRLLNGVAMNAQRGSRWGVYGPNETRFIYGAALTVGIVQQLSGRDAILRVEVPPGQLPPGPLRAIPVAPPAPETEAVPLELVGVSGQRASALAQAIRDRVPNARLVASGEFARFQLAYDGGNWRVMDAGGLQEVMRFADQSDVEVADVIAGFVTRFSASMGLLALENPASSINLWVGVQTAYTAQRPPPATRGLVLVTDDPAPMYSVRRAGEPRSPQNSLILEIRADRPVYLTIASVDTKGGINLLFPNRYQRPEFLPNGLIPGERAVRIPDSLQSNNRSGFYWDYSPPTGTETIRVFGTETPEQADLIREFIAQAAQDRAALGELGGILTASVTRGIKVVADEPPSADDMPPMQAGGPIGDWTAASVVIQIQP